MLKFPIAVKEIQKFMPHRDPAIWIDEVLEVTDGEGKCKIVFSENALYVTNGTIRASSFVEWIGQAYGYVMACEAINAGWGETQLKRAYLVGVRNLVIQSTPEIKNGDVLFVSVTKTHELGPMIMIQGTVQTADGRVLATGQVKIFAEG